MVRFCLYQTCTAEKVRSTFRVTGFVPFNFDTFLRHTRIKSVCAKGQAQDAKPL